MSLLHKPAAIIFDWDDTLVDNWETALTALNTTLVHMGMEPWSEEETRRRSGPTARALFTQLFGEDRWEEADKVYYDAFCALVKQNPRLHDGADKLLQLLADNNIHMAVVSNKRNPLLSEEVSIMKFGRFFKKVLGAGEASADKPDAAPLLHTLKEIGVTPGPHVWYIGDSHTDMMCAIAAGCTAVLFESKPPPADLLIKNPPAARFSNHTQLMEYVARYFA